MRGPVQVLAPLLAMRVACEAADRFLTPEVVRLMGYLPRNWPNALPRLRLAAPTEALAQH